MTLATMVPALFYVTAGVQFKRQFCAIVVTFSTSRGNVVKSGESIFYTFKKIIGIQ